MSDWISVKDRLPERTIRSSLAMYSENLLFTDGSEVYVGYCEAPRGQKNPRWRGYDIEALVDTFYYECQGAEDVENVSHWMPLPEPPEEGKHE